MCIKCDLRANGYRDLRKRGPMETVYLPGDREPTMLAEAIYRDSRLTWMERRAAILATDCSLRKRAYLKKWHCNPKRPCTYCREIND